MRTFGTLMILVALGAFFLAGVAALVVLGFTAYPVQRAPGQDVPVEAYVVQPPPATAVIYPGQVVPGQDVPVEAYDVQPTPAAPVTYAAPPVTWITILFSVLVPLTLLALLGLVFFMVAMRLVGRRPHQAKAHEAIEEARLIQELYHGMSRMEQRIETLETLLLDRAVPPEFHAAEPRRHTGAR
jgi:phage shock protein B